MNLCRRFVLAALVLASSIMAIQLSCAPEAVPAPEQGIKILSDIATEHKVARVFVPQFSTRSTEWVDIPGSQVDITLDETSVVLILFFMNHIRNDTPGAYTHLRAMRDALGLCSIVFRQPANSPDYLMLGNYVNVDQALPPGTYTYNMQMCVSTGTGLVASSVELVLIAIPVQESK